MFWTVHRTAHPGSERRPTRTGLPDYGEFGRFERLIYSAYFWSVVAAVADIAVGLSALVGGRRTMPQDPVRHLYLLGFITNLIFGMSVRMFPGFIHRRKVASRALVDATFWLGNAATVCRVGPLLLPPRVLGAVPQLSWLSRVAFGLSGIIGIVAVGCLAVNLWVTARRAPDGFFKNPAARPSLP